MEDDFKKYRKFDQHKQLQIQVSGIVGDTVECILNTGPASVRITMSRDDYEKLLYYGILVTNQYTSETPEEVKCTSKVYRLPLKEFET